MSSGYSYPADVWSTGMSLLAVAKGHYPLQEPRSEADEAGEGKEMEFWDLVDYICVQPSPVPGSGFSDEFADFIASCLRKDPEDRLTAAQLLDHKFLLKRNSPVSFGDSQTDVLGTAWRDAVAKKPSGGDFAAAVGNVRGGTLFEQQQGQVLETESDSRPMLSFRGSSRMLKSSSRSKAQLAELVEDAVTSVSRGSSSRQMLRADTGCESDDFGELESNVDEIINSLQDVSFVDDFHIQPDHGEHTSDRHEIIEIRLRHLQTILEKVQQKYAFVESLNQTQIQALKQASHVMSDASIGFQKQRSTESSSSIGSASVTSSFLSDRMVLLPCLEGRGQIMWEKFARQLHLPFNIVMKRIRGLVDERYFKQS